MIEKIKEKIIDNFIIIIIMIIISYFSIFWLIEKFTPIKPLSRGILLESYPDLEEEYLSLAILQKETKKTLSI